MANVKKSERVQDTDIKRLNHVGLGLKAIADKLGCHAATVTTRLKALGVKPIDTRRSFLEQVFEGLTPDEQDWLSHNLYNADISIREFVVQLIKEAFSSAPAVAPPTPAPMPELKGPEEDPLYKAPAAVDLSQVAELVVTSPPSPEVLAQAEAVSAATVHEIVDSTVTPEYVQDTLPVPLCGICHENAVEADGEVCVGCGTVPVTKTESVFG